MRNILQTFAFSEVLGQFARDFDAHLAVVLDDFAAPIRLQRAMRHALLAGGKRFRPFLLTQTAAVFDVSLAAALPAAIAIECIHSYSLAHDDLPAMDNDDFRRGQPTLHRAFDEATAILAGDALQVMAFELLADERSHADASVRARLIFALARASGGAGMVGGQMLDLAAEGRFEDGNQSLVLEDIRTLQAMKTGALIVASVEMGAYLGGASCAQHMALRTYAQALGEAFQIADDLLDVEGNFEVVGKKTQKDQGLNKGTFVSTLGVEGARARAEELIEQAIASLEGFATKADFLRQAAVFAQARKS